MDLTSAESKATYEEIREYVFEHTGLKVSRLYIAQVKQKCGIIERENYNKPKSENEWSGFAALLANLIEKYAVVLNLDALPDLVIEEAVSEKDDADKNIHENDIEPAKAE